MYIHMLHPLVCTGCRDCAGPAVDVWETACFVRHPPRWAMGDYRGLRGIFGYGGRETYFCICL